MSTTSWQIGSIELLRVPYFDIGLPPEGIGLEGVAEEVPWAAPWLTDGLPTVGQAFWVLRTDGQTVVVDPSAASDFFLRSGPDAVGHQDAAFELLRAAGVDPETVDTLVFSHLDGIGMAALADGGAAGAETWTPAFPNARLIISQLEYDFIKTTERTEDELPGKRAFNQLDALGVVGAVAAPHQVAEGVTLRHTGTGHSPGHCALELESQGEKAIMLGHLAISPLHAAAGIRGTNHRSSALAWDELQEILDDAAANDVLVAGPLWPAPGAVKVVATNPYKLEPVGSSSFRPDA